MIGVTFLAAGLLWLALAAYLSARLPQWLGFKKLLWPARAALFALLLVGPFVDHIVGMQQFQKLCDERTTPRIARDARSVEWGERTYSTPIRLEGYAINILATTASYTDQASRKVFLEYEHFSTKGGRIAGLAMMGGQHSCSVEQVSSKHYSQIKSIPAYQKIVNGVSK